MERAELSQHPDPAAIPVADVVALSLARAPEVSTTTPGDLEDGVVAVEVEDAVRDDEPPSRAEVEELGRQLRGWHGGSLRVVYGFASLLPRRVLVEAVQSVIDSESARLPVAVLVSILRDSAARNFADTLPQPTRLGPEPPSESRVQKLRRDPEGWVRAMAAETPTDVVEEYLTAQVEDEIERQRLRRLADELREKT